MKHKAKKQGLFSLVAAVLVIAAALAWPSGAILAGKDNTGQYQSVVSNYAPPPINEGILGTAVWTQNGMVLGADDENQTWCWKGIPFAQPPVDDLRWKAPRSVGNWDVLEATEFGSMCPQYDAIGGFSGDEDCLYLNVWRPATQQLKLPVYVWIHGGGNSIGTANLPTYYMDKLASRGNMVVVTIQYRLGPLGWFIHPSLQHGDPLDDSGNYGTLDIIQALRWVQANITAFGGDPTNVTIAGESAGARNVCSLIISPAAKGLFHKAIAESGGFSVSSVEAGIASADAAIDRMVAKDLLSGRPADLEGYLRGKSTEDLFDVYGPWAVGTLSKDEFADLFTDGAVIHANGQAALTNPKTYNQVPTILGSNKEEMKLFLFTLYGTMSDEDYQAMTLASSLTWQRTGVNIPAMVMSVMKGQPPVYAYQFNYGAYNATGFNAWRYPLNVMIGAAHGLEMPFIFGNWEFAIPGIFGNPSTKPGQEALSADMVAYWASFARTGTPSAPSGVAWQPWSNKAGGPKRILFDADATKSIINMSNR